jgi:hypothetical protein
MFDNAGLGMPFGRFPPWAANELMRQQANAVLGYSGKTPPTERLKHEREKAKKLIEETEERLKTIEEVIELMEKNPTITKIFDTLAKLGIY